MAKYNEASETIKKFARSMKSLIEFSDELDKIGIIDNHFEELKVAKAKAEVELEHVKRDVEFQKGNLECAKVEADQLIEQGKETAKMLVAEAQKKCDALLEEADKNYKGAMNAAREVKEKSAVQHAQNQDKLAALNAEISEKEAKLAEVTKALEKIKGQI